MEKKIILGIDPGLRISGYSILHKQQKTILLDCGYLQLPHKEEIPVRIELFYNFFEQKIIKWGITDLSIETPFLGKYNSQTFLKLGYLRGIMYLLARKQSLLLHEFSPREVKQAVTGFGGAEKDQVARVIMQLFPMLETPKKLDVTDALAVALCGLWRNQQLVR